MPRRFHSCVFGLMLAACSSTTEPLNPPARTGPPSFQPPEPSYCPLTFGTSSAPTGSPAEIYTRATPSATRQPDTDSYELFADSSFLVRRSWPPSVIGEAYSWGRFERTGFTITFTFTYPINELNWQATGELRGDTLRIAYSSVMAHNACDLLYEGGDYVREQ